MWASYEFKLHWNKQWEALQTCSAPIPYLLISIKNTAGLKSTFHHHCYPFVSNGIKVLKKYIPFTTNVCQGTKSQSNCVITACMTSSVQSLVASLIAWTFFRCDSVKFCTLDGCLWVCLCILVWSSIRKHVVRTLGSHVTAFSSLSSGKSCTFALTTHNKNKHVDEHKL